ncbi:hypothetical protein N9L68_07675, partial [bacterium]|nr:hypothetical protein [bacterium]
FPIVRKLPSNKRNTDTFAQLEELAAGLPSAAPLPPKLADALENVGAPGYVNRPFLVASGKELHDAARAKLSRPDAPAKTFENDAPPRLALAVASTTSQLLVAPSMIVRGASGLFSARAFAKWGVALPGVVHVQRLGPRRRETCGAHVHIAARVAPPVPQTKDVRV